VKPPANDNGEEIWCPKCERVGFSAFGHVSFGFRLNGWRPPICIACKVEARFVIGF